MTFGTTRLVRGADSLITGRALILESLGASLTLKGTGWTPDAVTFLSSGALPRRMPGRTSQRAGQEYRSCFRCCATG